MKNKVELKVLHVVNGLGAGGAEKLILETLPLYKAEGVLVDLLILNDKDGYFLDLLRRYKDVNIYNLDLHRYNPLILFKMHPYFKSYDLLHVHLFPSLYWVSILKLLSLSSIKLVVTEHATSNRRVRSKILTILDRIIYSNYNKIITISKGVDLVTKKRLKFNESRFKLIFNGINLSNIFHSKASQDENILSFCGPGCKLMIQVSRFQKQKDHKTLIKAMTLLPDNVKLILVGDGELRKGCELLAKELQISNRIKFLGERRDVYELLKLADIVVLSTYFEGLSLSSIEGLASGAPFIGSNVPGLSEVIKNSGVLFPQGDYKELSRCVKNLLNDHNYYNSVVKKCIETSKMYDAQTTVKNCCKMYYSLF